MNVFDISMRLTALRCLLMIVVALHLMPMPSEAKDAPPALEGIHVHRSGASPYFLNAAKEALKTYEGQCKLMKSVCAMMPAGASAKDTAACTVVASGFSLKGNLADVGKQETDEYFATAMQMAARQTTKTVLQVKSICEVEVVDQESVDIWHYAPQAYTHYELKNHPKKGRYWVRSEHKRLAPKAGALLAGVYPMSDASKVSPVLGQKEYAGIKCDVREISGPWAGTFCLSATGTAFPGHLTLAETVVAGKDTMLEEQATAVAVKVMLPRPHFFPPERDKLESTQAHSASPENPTLRWCAKQKIKTGIDPCKEAASDD